MNNNLQSALNFQITVTEAPPPQSTKIVHAPSLEIAAQCRKQLAIAIQRNLGSPPPLLHGLHPKSRKGKSRKGGMWWKDQ